ncbi:MAG TPA: ASCH domain-containing protein [Gaiellaceae bacterium]|nr:ASCH domain-containing protein [Gaiellaceae bacterium]
MSDLPPFELGYARTELRRRLVEAALAGRKRATAGLAESDQPEDKPGRRYALLGYDDQPVGVVELTEARVVPASEVDEQFARDEGEGFESVEDWRVAHERFIEQPIERDRPIEAVRFRLVEDG